MFRGYELEYEKKISLKSVRMWRVALYGSKARTSRGKISREFRNVTLAENAESLTERNLGPTIAYLME